MGLNDYMPEVMKTASYPMQQAREYVTLGLAGEAGEVANKMKKIMRGDLSLREATPGISKELGDVFWYWIACCVEFNLNPEDVVLDMLMRLEDRKQRGVIKGSGDDR